MDAKRPLCIDASQGPPLNKVCHDDLTKTPRNYTPCGYAYVPEYANKTCFICLEPIDPERGRGRDHPTHEKPHISTWAERDSTRTTLADLEDWDGETIMVGTRIWIVLGAEERNRCRHAQTREGGAATIGPADAGPADEGKWSALEHMALLES